MQGAGFVLLILSVVKNSAVPIASDLKSEDVFKIKLDFINNNGNQGSLSGVLFKTVMRYYCLPRVLNDSSSIILYGSNGWTFPEQDVNLTLSYPTSDDSEIRRNIDNYLITGYEVLLFTDGMECTGSIASGGLMRNHITLNFAVSDIRMLSYEFWLYGVPGPAGIGGGKTHQNYNRMC